MTKPLVIFCDPETVVVDYYKSAFAPRAESYKPATINTAYPSTSLGATTALQVELEVGGTDGYPTTERAQVRVTAHAGKDARSNAKRLASLAQGLLFAHPGDANVAGTLPLVGRSDVIRDPDTGNLMVWFLFRVDLKATQLAS